MQGLRRDSVWYRCVSREVVRKKCMKGGKVEVYGVSREGVYKEVRCKV